LLQVTATQILAIHACLDLRWPAQTCLVLIGRFCLERHRADNTTLEICLQYALLAFWISIVTLISIVLLFSIFF
jgi:hypothetical protein